MKSLKSKPASITNGWIGKVRPGIPLGTPLAKHIKETHRIMTKREINAYYEEKNQND